jgi:FkbM family methyltransferase
MLERLVQRIRGVDTLRTLRDLESWSLRMTFARFVVERRLGLPYRGQLAPAETAPRVKRDGYWFEPRYGTADREVLAPFHEVQTRRFLRGRFARTRRRGVFVDVGAHCGSFSIPFESFFDRVLSIEPLPDNCGAIARNIELNGLPRKIHVFNVAAGAAEGEGTLFVNGDELSSLLSVRAPSNPMSVQVRPLDDLLREASVSAGDVRLLKVDVEGAELQVLAGARRLLDAACPIVVLEANTPDAARAVEMFMRNIGYVLVRVTDRRNLCFERAR